MYYGYDVNSIIESVMREFVEYAPAEWYSTGEYPELRGEGLNEFLREIEEAFQNADSGYGELWDSLPFDARDSECGDEIPGIENQIRWDLQRYAASVAEEHLATAIEENRRNKCYPEDCAICGRSGDDFYGDDAADYYTGRCTNDIHEFHCPNGHIWRE